MEQHNRQGYRRRVRTRLENTRPVPQDEQTEVEIMTAEETREQLRQEYIRKQEEHIRKELETELVDHMILQFTGKDFLTYDDFIKTYRTEAIAFMTRYDIITPSIQLKTIKNTLDKYIDFRHQILEKKIMKNKKKQTWKQWLFRQHEYEVVSLKTEKELERVIKMEKLEEAYQQIKQYKELKDESELTMDYETMYESENFTFPEESVRNNTERPVNTNFTNK